MKNNMQNVSTKKSVFQPNFNLVKNISLIDAMNNFGNFANYSIFGKNQRNKTIIYIQKRTMFSCARVTSLKIGVYNLYGVNSRGYSSWSAWRFDKTHPNYDQKGHYTAVNDDDIKNNAKMPDWRFTHATPAIGHPKDPDVIETHKISETDLKGLQKPQSIARRQNNGFTNQDLSGAKRNKELDSLFFIS